MSGNGPGTTLPTRLARRRLLVGRLFLAATGMNLLFALLAGWALSGPAAHLTRFRLGFGGWAAMLFLTSMVLVVPFFTVFARRILNPSGEEGRRNADG